MVTKAVEKRDLVVIGGGPAGLSAALVASSNFMTCLVLEKSLVIGGQIRLADAPVLDVLGQPADNGLALIEHFRGQIEERSEVSIRCGAGVQTISRTEQGFSLKLDNDQDLIANAIILATGTQPRTLNIPGSDVINSHEHARSIVDEFAGKSVTVIGGGDEASDIAVCLAKAGAKVSVLVRSKLRARPRFSEPLLATEGIEILEEVQATSIESAGAGHTLHLSNGETLAAAEIFVRIGVELAIPDIEPAPNRHEDGRLKIDDFGRTSIPGLYAAGDICRHPEQWYVAVAMADGTIAARAVEDDRYAET